MKYEEMSDQQINHAVGMIVSRDNISAVSATGEVCVHAFNDSGLCVAWKIFDPCNSWADAGPIIQEFGIELSFGSNTHPSLNGLCMASIGQNSSTNANPLRAAMIVFLMMNEVSRNE